MVVGDITIGTQVVVIGGGPGGYVAAIRAAQLGKEVTLVEKEDLGGVCLNRGCIPSKAIIHASNKVHSIKQSDVFGLEISDWSFNMEKLIGWKQSIVSKLTNGVQALLDANNIKRVKGHAMFISKNKIEVSSEYSRDVFEFDNAIVATGSRPAEIPGLEFDGDFVISSTEALNLTSVPKELIVLGGGYIGLELGTAFVKLGARVTIIEMQDQLLSGYSRDLVQPVYRKLKQLGVEVLTDTELLGYERKNNNISIKIKTQQGERFIEADKLLVTVGRRPNTHQLGLEQAGVDLDEKGFIINDSQCRTSNPDIFAIGDVAGNPMLAHKASKEGTIAAEVISGMPSEMDVYAMPAVIFTDPEIATVGLTAESAKAEGFDIKTGKFPFGVNGRALSTNQTEGFVQVVAEQNTSRVLGIQIVGPEASTLIGEAALAIELGANVKDIVLTVHPHPTLEEALMEAAASVLGEAIHTINGK
ncbi:dihydrolipoyl dehydrogenase [Bacillus sp. M6-12]|uniref:dihydrolipoyl dehydrogenase n=1 Tax=Bacillus sp. M6-12 TaxID=2054166 RepID=UPI000C792BC8|nr:dihydrolipoyl dehydrogenase [Bacillus sp. M6-12]PLS15266.1 dihydrolipoyl dehydrogenase [Bacillus sp. M6-12]